MSSPLSEEWQRLCADAICYAAQMTTENIRYALASYERPSVLHRPRVFIEGDKWCALYGDNIQDGVAGFGDTVCAAMFDFDKNWNNQLAVL